MGTFPIWAIILDFLLGLFGHHFFVRTTCGLGPNRQHIYLMKKKKNHTFPKPAANNHPQAPPANGKTQ